MLVSVADPGRGYGRSRAWLFAALPAVFLLLACNSDDGPAEDAAVAASGAGLSTETPVPTATATPTATGTVAPSIEDLAVAAWGEEVCGIADDFALGFLASGDPRNPAELGVEERKDRAEVMFPVQLDTVAQAIARLDQTEPPDRTAELHALLRTTYVELQSALELQREQIRAATTADEISASNLPVNQLIDLAFRQGALLVNAGYCRNAGEQRRGPSDGGASSRAWSGPS